jgi:site-specific recombinase XerD
MRRRDRYKKGKKTKQVNVATVNREICCLKTIFRKVVEWGKATENPTSNVKTAKETPEAPRLLESEEIVHLMEELPDHLKALGACIVYAGLRRSEVFYLLWKDINWKTGEISVVSRQEHHTKNYETRRIPMSDTLIKALKRHPRHLGSPYVFCNREGQTYNNVRKSLNKAAKQADIEDGISMHQLRHAFCSHALMQGIDPRTVQKWMGHKDMKTTLRYAHVSPDHEKAAIQKLRYEKWTPMDTKTA